MCFEMAIREKARQAMDGSVVDGRMVDTRFDIGNQLVTANAQPIMFDLVPLEIRRFYNYEERVREIQRLVLRHASDVPSVS